MKKLLLLASTAFLALAMTGCKKKETTTKDYVKDIDWRTPAQLLDEYEHDNIDDKEQMSKAKFTISFRDDNDVEYIGYMEFILFEKIAPKTVKNFKDLIKIGYYDNLTITRIVTDVTIQGGDGNVTTTGEAKKTATTIEGEFEDNEFSDNVLSHRRGVISMARASDYNSASSQFFVVANSFTSCDGAYAGFGWLDKYDYTLEERANAKEDGVRVLYDYDCLDKIASLGIVDDIGDGAPVQLVKIVKAELL